MSRATQMNVVLEKRCTELEAERMKLEGSLKELEERTEREVALRKQANQVSTAIQARLGQAEEKLGKAEQRHREAEEKLRQVEQKHREAEERLGQAEQRHKKAEENASEVAAKLLGQAEQRYREVEDRANVVAARLQQAEQRTKEAEERATEVVGRLKQAERMQKEAEERVNIAEASLIQAEERYAVAERMRKEMERRQIESEHRFLQKERRCTELTGEKKEVEDRLKELEETVENEVSRREQATQHTSTAEARLRQFEQRHREAEKKMRQEKEEVEERMREAEKRMREEKEEVEERMREAEKRTRQGKEEAEERMRKAEERMTEAEERLHVAERRHRDKEQHNRQIMQHQIWMIEREEIQLTDQELGRGGWAVVKVADFRGIRVAAKCMHGIIISEYNRELFVREMNFAAKLRHPNLVQFIGATLVGEPVILTELMSTSLRAVLEEQRLRPEHIVPICCNVAKVLNYLHLMRPDPIVHRDVSSANVLMNEGPHNCWFAKLSDYGTTNFVWQVTTAGPGNPSYAAPEAGNPSQQSPKMDVYSYGVLLVEIATQRFPDKKTIAQQIQEIERQPLQALIQSCIEGDSHKRPTMSVVLTRLQNCQQT